MHFKAVSCLIITIFLVVLTKAHHVMMPDVQHMPQGQEKYENVTQDQEEYLHVRSKRSRGSRFMGSGCSCGGAFSMSNEPSPLIVNGQKVQPTNKYPWMVALIFSENRQKFCGGAIISEDYVLTAAHCLRRAEEFIEQRGSECATVAGQVRPCFLDPEAIEVAFLTSNPMKVSRGKRVQEIIPHPEFSMESNTANDIALIKMERPMKCSEYTRPICLPGPNMRLEEGEELIISGWGSPDPPAIQETPDLREARLTVLSPQECKSRSPGFSPFKGASYCLRGYHNQSPCFGDSGGSGVTLHDNRYYAMGVASAHTSTVCEVNSPVIYTSVSAYMNWIKQHTGLGSESMFGGRFFGKKKRKENRRKKTKKENSKEEERDVVVREMVVVSVKR